MLFFKQKMQLDQIQCYNIRYGQRYTNNTLLHHILARSREDRCNMGCREGLWCQSCGRTLFQFYCILLPLLNRKWIIKPPRFQHLINNMRYLFFCLLIALTLGAYNTHNGLDLAYFSKIAYDPIASITGWNCGSCSRFKMTDIKAFTNSSWDMQGYVGYSSTHGAIIVAFRGSANIKNWISDFDAAQVGYGACSGCNVHRGFSNSYGTVSSYVKSQVEVLIGKYRSAPIYVTGHSLGGAIAIVAALDIHRTYGKAIKLYTFGEPRVGNAAFAAYVAAQIPDTFRVIHYADMVPHLPPAASNYKHTNFEVWYQEDMKSYKVCNAEDSSCSNSVVPKLSTSDHDISFYIKIVAVSQEKPLKNIIRNIRRVYESFSNTALLLSE